MLLDDAWRFSPIGPIATSVGGVIGAGLLMHVNWVRSTRARAVTWALLVVCVLVILAVTARGVLGNDDGYFSWHVGRSIRGELRNIDRELGLLNVFGNVLMFVPIGWLSGLLARRRALWVGGLSAAGLSMAIEIWQMLSGWFGDVDDVVLNSIGGLIGAILAAVLRAVSKRLRDPWADIAAHDRTG